MRNEHRAILALVAARRITAPEAERLLRACSECREAAWLGLACVLACLAQVHWQTHFAALGHFAQALLSQAATIIHTVSSLMSRGMGGTV